jgi:hypothetical protein
MGECGCNLEVARCKAHANDVALVGDRAEMVYAIAAELDKPSVYMGGPSARSLRIAGAVMDRLASRFDVIARSRKEPT